MNLEAAMQRADELSIFGLGKTSPNPIVGALIVDDAGKIIAEGFHQKNSDGSAGRHAEIVALQEAGDRARGATLIVTLEPCNHFGKTSPCSDAIIAAGISRVVYAIDDPHHVASGGAAKLRAAGIEVISGVCEQRVRFTNRAWLFKINNARPYITAKVAATLDGYIAASDGSSKWITSNSARDDVAMLRSQCDAIVTSTGTVLADDPLLTARVPGVTKHPIRIVLGERTIPSSAKIMGHEAPTQIIRSRDLQKLFDFARNEGCNRLLLEAGPTLISSFLRAQLIDEMYLYQAPTLLGSGKSMVNDLGIKNLSQRIDFTLQESTVIGEGDKRNTRLHLIAKGSN
jgi:diaminohydroxyphosphoribosylaminopyrimidine deaminase/5-amino-6-(5-phosphoribosylamino)uracil reductase